MAGGKVMRAMATGMWEMVSAGRRMTAAAGAAIVVTVSLLLASCGTSPADGPGGGQRSPFTGEPIASAHRVLAVKIDNIAQARPPTGLAKADIVYVLPVEGGLSRILAIFSSHYPRVVGPVRSAREDDIELLRQFGQPAFAYSGATPTLLPYIHSHAAIVDLYAGTAGGYFRDPGRVPPYNLYAHTKQLMAQAPDASAARDIGFRFGPAPAGGHRVTSASAAYPAASFRFTWSAAKGRWLVSMDGTPAGTTDGGRLSAATVVIQHTTVRTSRFLEYGSPPPYAESTGSGTAIVLRGGKAYSTHWSRPAADSGTTFTTADGHPMTFAPGPVWVILVSR
jgi:DUF3048 family protein